MKRSELYERIWSTPASKIADDLGLSGSRVAAICKRHNIPTPPRGYWAKLAVGKLVPKTPLPQPEADYELKLAAPPPKPSPWVAPGVLLRPDAIEQPAPPPRRVAPYLKQAAAWPFPLANERAFAPDESAAQSSVADVDLELLRAAAAELRDKQAIRDLLQGLTARAVHASPGEAQRILSWATSVRARLDEQDPIAAVLRLAVQARRAD